MNSINPEVRAFFESQPLDRARAVIQKAEQPGGELLRYVLVAIFEILTHTRSRALNIFPKPSESAIVTDYRTLVREDIRSILEGFSWMRHISESRREGIEFLFPDGAHSLALFFQLHSFDPLERKADGVEELWMQGGYVFLMPITGASVASTKKVPLGGNEWAYMSIPQKGEARVSLQGGEECAAFSISRISQL